MKITSDPILGKAAQSSQYHEIFSQLTPESNCIVFETTKEMYKVYQSLYIWSKKHIHPKVKVKTTSYHRTDGKPRCWLIWPDEATPSKAVTKGQA